MNMSLKEIRAEWDKGENIIAEIPIFINNSDIDEPNELDRLIVILKDPLRKKYRILRYFKINDFPGSSFHVSVDFTGFCADEVFAYIERTYPNGLRTNLMELV